MWTLGVTIWELCELGKLPYYHMGDSEVVQKVLISKSKVPGLPTLPYLAHPGTFSTILSTCWNYQPSRRPHISTIVSRLEETENEVGIQEAFQSKWNSNAASSKVDFYVSII